MDDDDIIHSLQDQLSKSVAKEQELKTALAQSQTKNQSLEEELQRAHCDCDVFEAESLGLKKCLSNVHLDLVDIAKELSKLPSKIQSFLEELVKETVNLQNVGDGLVSMQSFIERILSLIEETVSKANGSELDIEIRSQWTEITALREALTANQNTVADLKKREMEWRSRFNELLEENDALRKRLQLPTMESFALPHDHESSLSFKDLVQDPSSTSNHPVAELSDVLSKMDELQTWLKGGKKAFLAKKTLRQSSKAAHNFLQSIGDLSQDIARTSAQENAIHSSLTNLNDRIEHLDPFRPQMDARARSVTHPSGALQSFTSTFGLQSNSVGKGNEETIHTFRNKIKSEPPLRSEIHQLWTLGMLNDQRMDDIVNEQDESEKEKSDLVKLLQQQTKELEEAKTKTEEMVQKKKILQNQVDCIKKEISSTKAKESQLSFQIQKLEMEYASVFEQKGNVAKSLQLLEEKIRLNEIEISKIEQNVFRLQKDLPMTEKEKDQLEAKLQTKASELEELECQKRDLRNVCDKLSREILSKVETGKLHLEHIAELERVHEGLVESLKSLETQQHLLQGFSQKQEHKLNTLSSTISQRRQEAQKIMEKSQETACDPSSSTLKSISNVQSPAKSKKPTLNEKGEGETVSSTDWEKLENDLSRISMSKIQSLIIHYLETALQASSFSADLEKPVTPHQAKEIPSKIETNPNSARSGSSNASTQTKNDHIELTELQSRLKTALHDVDCLYESVKTMRARSSEQTRGHSTNESSRTDSKPIKQSTEVCLKQTQPVRSKNKVEEKSESRSKDG